MQTLYSIRETARLLRVRTDRVRRWVRLGLLRAVNLGEKRANYRIPADAIDSLLSDLTVAPKSSARRRRQMRRKSDHIVRHFRDDG